MTVTVPGVYQQNCVIALTGRMITYRITFRVDGSMHLPKCDFDFRTNPTCDPQVIVNNFGQTRNPRVVQNNVATEIQYWRPISFDRSAGPLDIAVGPFDAADFQIFFGVQNTTGLQIGVSEKFYDLADRMSTYARIAAAKASLDELAIGPDADKSVKAKTLATLIHILSAEAVQRQYLQEVKGRLHDVANDIIGDDSSVCAITHAIVENDTIAPQEFDLTIAKIDDLISKTTPGQRQELSEVRKQLEDAKEAATKTGSAIQILRDKFNTELGRKIAEYQGLVLEFAQYVPVESLMETSAINPNERDTVSRHVQGCDMIITDRAFDGQGSAIRTAFGLLSPNAVK